MTLLDDLKSFEDLDAEALIKEARRLRRRRWSYGVAAAVVVAGGIGVLAATIGGSSGSFGINSASAAADNPPGILAALEHVPTPLAVAVLQTIDARSFVWSRGIDYNAPDKLSSPETDFFQRTARTTCPSVLPQVPSSTETGEVIIGSTEYSVSFSCPGNKYSMTTTKAEPGYYGMTPAQSWVSASVIRMLDGGTKFMRTSSGYSFYVSAAGGFGVDRSIPAQVQIRDGYVTQFIYYLRSEVDQRAIPLPLTFSDFNRAPSIKLPVLPK